MSKPRVLSGIQPSGNLHLGNYLGAIKNFAANQAQFENYFCVVDHHAITNPQDPKALYQQTFDVANAYLAAGLDPKEVTIFIQSHVPEHTELGWILNSFCYFGELRRMTQFKDKAGKHPEEVGVGIFDYPVLMAADIVLYDANFVPVGEDQRQHLELTRDIANRVNYRLGEGTLVVPEPLIKKEGARIMGLDDPAKKMSKSATTPRNYIALTDDPDTIRQKLRAAVTDSGSEIRFSEDKPALTNLLTIYSLLSDTPIPMLEERYQGQGYAQFKSDLADVVVEALGPFQTRLRELDSNPDYTLAILRDGAARAQAQASTVLRRVKERMGYVLPS
ncbi:MAG: tryptophan--tRNA ligase [Anaerolineae bacterium]|nr:tryptophan--tRNA ligase [Anaerolineae bacterium]